MFIISILPDYDKTRYDLAVHVVSMVKIFIVFENIRYEGNSLS